MRQRNFFSLTAFLLIFILVLLIIYALPSATAKFAGSHTWEFNSTYGVTALKCGKCHGYIKSEMLSNKTPDALSSHLSASSNSSYVGPGKIINITRTPSGNYDDVCYMCHVVEDTFTAASHTKVTIRVCTDVDCHGDSTNAPGNTSCDLWDDEHCNVTGRINETDDAHRNFYYPLTKINTSYISEEGKAYDAGFVACLACHTHVGLDINVTRPYVFYSKYNFTGNLKNGYLNMTEFGINASLLNSSTSQKLGSAWE